MRYRALTVCAAVAGLWAPAIVGAQVKPDASLPPTDPMPEVAAGEAGRFELSAPTSPPGAVRPVRLSMLQQDSEGVYPPTIYRPAAAPREEDGVNAGGVNLSLNVNYMTDYVYRGLDRSEVGGAEDAPNLQFDGKLSFNLGKLPHPVVGLFVNVYNDDPVSRFQEVRPFVGFDWTLRPLTVSAGQISYIFPEREEQNTSEVYFNLALDDGFLFRSGQGLLNPYVFAAYDYDKFDGLYIEGGVRHDFPLEDVGVVISAVADIAYVVNNRQYSGTVGGEDTGFQHYDVGLVGTYSLNTLLNLPKRYGEWSLKGYLYYTDGIENDLKADSQLWGGVGINFEY